jgi:hypothetical protein
MNKELLGKIDEKLKETRSLRNLSSRDFRFKNWHASTINLLKILPSEFSSYVNDFKKLTFTDTKYHRGARPFNPLDDTKYSEDLDSAVDILKKITLEEKESKSVKISGDKKDNASRKETAGKSKKKETASAIKSSKASIKESVKKSVQKEKTAPAKKTSSPKKSTKTAAKGKTSRTKKSG